MVFTVPNEASATYLPQAAIDTTDLNILIDALGGHGVLSGCAVSAPAVAGRTVDVASGTVQILDTVLTISAVASLAIAAPGATDRRDLISVNTSGTVFVTQGTASSATVNGVTPAGSRDPAKPANPASSIALAEVYVPANLVNIASTHITDKRAFIEPSADSGWQNITPAAGFTSGTLRYRKVGDLVHVYVDGSAATTSGSILTIASSGALPTAARPPLAIRGSGYFSGFAGHITIGTGGDITVIQNSGASRTTVAGYLTYFA